MIYRIYNERGHIDTAFCDMELCAKVRRYERDAARGYSKYIRLTAQSGMNGAETEIYRKQFNL